MGCACGTKSSLTICNMFIARVTWWQEVSSRTEFNRNPQNTVYKFSLLFTHIMVLRYEVNDFVCVEITPKKLMKRHTTIIFLLFLICSTIGFGDLVPNHPKFFLLTIIYIFFGLALISTGFTVLQQVLQVCVSTVRSQCCQWSLVLVFDAGSVKRDKIKHGKTMTLIVPLRLSTVRFSWKWCLSVKPTYLTIKSVMKSNISGG